MKLAEECGRVGKYSMMPASTYRAFVFWIALATLSGRTCGRIHNMGRTAGRNDEDQQQ
jgi:hypothetical protein